MRLFRYEVRRWREGIVPDADLAVGGPQRLSVEPAIVEGLLRMVDDVPALVWGRDERATGEMWNSNSVISWLLTVSVVDVDEVRPPDGGRAPGWDAGIAVARSAVPAMRGASGS